MIIRKKNNTAWSTTIKFVILLLLVTSCEKEENEIMPETVTDIDGNVYHTVQIGGQLWMVENLRTTKFNDGATIPLVYDSTAWVALTTPGMAVFNNSTHLDTINTYGNLYNWYAVNTGKLCPKGWRVPTEKDWDILIDYLGGPNVAGEKLKEAGTVHWDTIHVANNMSGFTAVPGGQRGANGKFNHMGRNAYFWSQTVGYYLTLGSQANSINLSKNFGFSVCCVKD